MRFVFLSYHYSPDIQSPKDWLERINFYVGSLEYLSKTNTVIRIDQINYEGNFTHNGVQYFCIKPSRKKNYFPIKLHCFVKNLKPDIVIVGSFNNPFQIIQLRVCLGKKVKIIVQNHAEKPFRGIKKFVQKISDKFVNAYFFASEIMGADWVKNGIISSEKKIYEVMEVSSVFHPIDKKVAKSKTFIAGNPIFLWAGRLNENKDPLTVVNAFLNFSQFHSRSHLYMIFQTEELLHELKLLIAKNNCNTITFIGKVPHKEILYWLNSSDFIISGSHYEGSGTVICEAMSCGCVPIVTNIPSFRAITANGVCGFLYEPGNENALLSAMTQALLTDTEKIRNKILKHYKMELSFEAIARKIQEVAAAS